MGAAGFPTCNCSVRKSCTAPGWAERSPLLNLGLLEQPAWDAGVTGVGCWSGQHGMPCVGAQPTGQVRASLAPPPLRSPACSSEQRSSV